MSVNLNVSDKHDKKMMFYIIVGAAVVLGVIIILFLLVFGAIIIRIRSNRRRYGYQELPGVSSDDFTSYILMLIVLNTTCMGWFESLIFGYSWKCQ